MWLRPRDLNSCARVCRRWNTILSTSKKLTKRRGGLDIRDRIVYRKSFGKRNNAWANDYSGVCISPKGDEILVTDSVNNRISVFGVDGKFISSLDNSGINRLNNPRGILVSGPNIFVCDCFNQRIQIYNQDYNLASTISTKPFTPRYAHVFENGNILFSTDQDCIVLVDGYGKSLGEFGSRGQKEGEFRYPEGICVNSFGEIIVIDSWNSRVQLFDQQGQFLRSFGSEGKGPGCLYYPKGVCLDSDDNILVADYYNDRVTVFSRHGSPIKEIRIVEEEPKGICLWGKRILVASFSTICILE